MQTDTITPAGVELAQKALGGTIFLVIRRIVVQVVQISSTVFLARLLLPETFGVFAISVFAVELLALLPGQGFVAAIIQKKGNLSEREKNTVFLSLLAFGLVAAFVIFTVAPILADFGKVDVFVIRLLAVAALLLNLKLVPLSILEREIKYKILAIVEIFETVMVAVVSVIAAYFGLGIMSLILGYLSGKTTSVVFLYLFGPYLPKFDFSLRLLGKFAGFAINYQVYSVVGSISGAIAPFYVGRFAGPVGVGYLTWAGGVGLIPWAFGELLGRVMFPVLSRSQGKKKLFSTLLSHSIEVNLAIVTPLSILLLVFSESITVLVFGEKWLPALPALRFFVLLGYMASLTVLSNSAISAYGKIRYVRNVSLVGTFLFWILAFLLIPRLGFWAHPLAWFLGSSVSMILIFKISRLLKIYYFRLIFQYLGICFLTIVPFALLVRAISSIGMLILVLMLAFFSYLAVLLLFKRAQIDFFIKQFKIYLRK